MKTTRTTRTIATAIHDTIADGATTIEEIHRSIADLSLELLGTFRPLGQPIEELHDLQSRAITSAYGLFRRANDRVEEVVTDVLAD
ncbi:MAG: hypothetical protein E4H03_05830 [Myxococcales bacterium]|nr:MAG: hypothetical protein E4H03_05830 [Myxococcales bacterium]